MNDTILNSCLRIFHNKEAWHSVGISTISWLDEDKTCEVVFSEPYPSPFLRKFKSGSTLEILNCPFGPIEYDDKKVIIRFHHCIVEGYNMHNPVILDPGLSDIFDILLVVTAKLEFINE